MALRPRPSMIPCAHSTQRRSTTGRGRSIASRVLSNPEVSTTCSTRSAAQTSARALARSDGAGQVVGFGFMGAPGILSKLTTFGSLFVSARLRNRRGTFYGITMLYQKDPKPLREDLPKIFALLAEKKIDPLVNRTFPLLAARQAIEFLATSSVAGKIVLLNG